MIRVDGKLKTRINFPAAASVLREARGRLLQTLLEETATDIVSGIMAGKSIVGGAFPPLEPATILKKGHDRPLIDKGLLSQEYTYQKRVQASAGIGILTIKPRTAKRRNKAGQVVGTDTPRDLVGRYLQIDGVGPGRKKFFFFGISKDMEARANQLISDVVALAMGVL